ncbi:GRIN2B [Lepeophtheirus salmonis]|uniref:GRIN2B n=1 Tax=Lepeophtheirus salmonis TaxID=72036 RepID=A0A7R8CAN0_LEPSM|nr:GRIN2B [Lepeophtheirus salmonis]CAF2752767.1 GRIN2B [Lepeophtheirus salmonis]
MNIGHEKLSSFGKQRVFNVDGSLRQTEMKIMNFKPRTQNSGLAWEEVGTWNSWNGLDIKDIVWPGGSHLPPQGVPEKFYMKITFLEEPPFIILSDPDPISSKCSMNRGVPCYMSEKHLRSHANSSQESTKCCSGLCIDLLRKFEDEMGFTYDLIRVEDPKWGTIEHGKWNGLMETLVNKKNGFSIKFSKNQCRKRSRSKRTGIISPTAFLEPFDTYSWMLVSMVAIQASAFSIFFFEWLSPSGYNMQVVPSKSNHRFSLVRTYWLVWAVLFQASVQVDCPRGLTARI